MERLSLYEKFKLEKISYVSEIEKIYKIYTKSHNAKFFFSIALKKSSFNYKFMDFESSMAEILEININPLLLKRKKNSFTIIENGLSNIINICHEYNKDLTLDSFLDFLEYIKTLESFGPKKYYDVNVEQIIGIVNNSCKKLGYEFKYIENEHYFYVMLKNSNAEAVSTFVEESTRNNIYSYLICRKGDLNNKRMVLKVLVDDAETLFLKLKDVKYIKKVKEFIQCIRHTKDLNNNKIKFPFYFENEEEWLDKSFEMIIGVFAYNKLYDNAKEILNLQNSK